MSNIVRGFSNIVRTFSNIVRAFSNILYYGLYTFPIKNLPTHCQNHANFKLVKYSTRVFKYSTRVFKYSTRHSTAKSNIARAILNMICAQNIPFVRSCSSKCIEYLANIISQTRAKDQRAQWLGTKESVTKGTGAKGQAPKGQGPKGWWPMGQWWPVTKGPRARRPRTKWPRTQGPGAKGSKGRANVHLSILQNNCHCKTSWAVWPSTYVLLRRFHLCLCTQARGNFSYEIWLRGFINTLKLQLSSLSTFQNL